MKFYLKIKNVFLFWLIFIQLSSCGIQSKQDYYEIGFAIQDMAGNEVGNSDFSIFPESLYAKTFFTDKYLIYYENSYESEYEDFSNYSRVFILENFSGRFFHKRNSYRNPPFLEEYERNRSKIKFTKTGVVKTIHGYKSEEYILELIHSGLTIKCFITSNLKYIDFLGLGPYSPLPGYIIQYEKKSRNGNMYNILRIPHKTEYSELYFGELNILNSQINPTLTRNLEDDQLDENIINNVNATFLPIKFYTDKYFKYEKIPHQKKPFQLVIQLRNRKASQVAYFDELNNKVYELNYMSKIIKGKKSIYANLIPPEIPENFSIIKDSTEVYNLNQYQKIEYKSNPKSIYFTLNDSTESIEFYSNSGQINKSYFIKNQDTLEKEKFFYNNNLLKETTRENKNRDNRKRYYQYYSNKLIKEIKQNNETLVFKYYKDDMLPIDTIKAELTNLETGEINKYLFEFDDNLNLRSIRKSYSDDEEYYYKKLKEDSKSQLYLQANKSLFESYLQIFLAQDSIAGRSQPQNGNSINQSSSNLDQYNLLKSVFHGSQKQYFEKVQLIPDIEITSMTQIFENETDEFYEIEFEENHLCLVEIEKGDFAKIIQICEMHQIEMNSVDVNNWRINLSSKGKFKKVIRNKKSGIWSF